MRSAHSRSLAVFRPQRGVVLVITLIALLILFLAGIALTRSFDASLLLSGNLAFKRDLVNQSERGVAAALKVLRSGALASETSRNDHLYASNYSATRLESDAHGIPLALTDETRFAALNMGGADLVDAASGVRIRYVIDRQCRSVGVFRVEDCVMASHESDRGGSSWLKKPGGNERAVYRVSVRVTGPRSTLAFFQTTLEI